MKIDCVKCGKRPAVSGGLCNECVLDSIKIRLKEELAVTECRKCGSLQVGNYWHDNPAPSTLGTEVKSHLQLTAPRLKLQQVNVVSFDLENSSVTGNIELEDAQSQIISKDFSLPLEVNHQSCPRCNRISGSSFEAIVQIRSMVDSPTKDFTSILTHIHKYAENTEDRKSSNYILKEIKVRGGMDIYLGSKALAEKILQMAASIRACNVMRTKKLFSRKDGQDLFRYTYLVRMMDVPQGHGIYVNDREYIVSESSPSVIRLFDLETQEIVEFSEKDFFRRRLKVSQNFGTYEKIQVLHHRSGGFTITGQDGKEDFIKSLSEYTEGETVNLLQYRGKFYYLPSNN